MVSSARFVQQMDAALKPVRNGNDRIVGSARVVSGVPPRLLAVCGALLGYLVGFFSESAPQHWQLAAVTLAVYVAWVGAVLLCYLTLGLQRPMLVAISREQLICARLT